jgi:hypothetical protein
MAGGSMPAWEKAGRPGGELGFSPLCQCINILDSESRLRRTPLPRTRVNKDKGKFLGPSTTPVKSTGLKGLMTQYTVGPF